MSESISTNWTWVLISLMLGYSITKSVRKNHIFLQQKWSVPLYSIDFIEAVFKNWPIIKLLSQEKALKIQPVNKYAQNQII